MSPKIKEIIPVEPRGKKRERYLKVPESYLIANIAFYDAVANDEKYKNFRPRSVHKAIGYRDAFQEIYQRYRYNSILKRVFKNVVNDLTTRWRFKRKKAQMSISYGAVLLTKIPPSVGDLKEIHEDEPQTNIVTKESSKGRLPEEVQLFLEGCKTILPGIPKR